VPIKALGRYEEALQALGKLVFQTFRSRLYRAAALMALNRLGEARQIVRDAMTDKPNFTVSRFLAPALGARVAWPILAYQGFISRPLASRRLSY
jgi:hypothetical protein